MLVQRRVPCEQLVSPIHVPNVWRVGETNCSQGTCRVTPRIKFAITHLNTWVERGIVRVKCLAQGYNTMSPARAQTQTAGSRDDHTNHEATPPMAVHERRYLLTAFREAVK